MNRRIRHDCTPILKTTTRKKPRSFCPTKALECCHHKGHSEIIAPIGEGETRDVIADIFPISGVSAEVLATYICSVINDSLSRKDLLNDAVDALELCLEEAGMTFSSEQAADRVITRIKKVCP